MFVFLLTIILQIIFTVILFLLGLMFTVYLVAQPYKPKPVSLDNYVNQDEQSLLSNGLDISEEIIRYKSYQENYQLTASYFKSNLLISKNVDSMIEEIIDLFNRDYLYDWYNELVKGDTHGLDVRLKNELWLILSRLLTFCRSFDDISFLTKDLVIILHAHIAKISSMLAKQDTYVLYDHLSSKDKEIDYLRKISRLIIALLLPARYAKSQPLVNLLQEIFAIHVFYNLIEMVSDPDYINQKIVENVRNHLTEIERHRKTYAYAKSYEEFIEMIKSCYSVEDLKKIRYRIVSEIMQATALENLKRQKMLDTEARPSSSQSMSKGDLLLNRDLRRYINNLQYAKNLCTKRINAIITYAYPQLSKTTKNPESMLPRDNPSYFKPIRKKILAFDIIIRSDLCRSFLRRFLQNSLGNSSDPADRTSKTLVLFWESVEEMKNQKGVKQYQIANELLKHSYFLNALSIHIKLTKNDRKGMEAFVRGDKGPESYYEAQSAVYSVLENRYYPLFIVSKEYDEMVETHSDSDLFGSVIDNSAESYDTTSQHSLEQPFEDQRGGGQRHSSFRGSVIDEHIAQARVKLQTLNKKIDGKQQALDAIKNTEHDSKLESNAKLVEILSKEIQDLREEMFELENHIVWSENWLANLGKWKAELHNIQLETQQSSSPLVIIIISSEIVKPSTEKSSSDGWIIARSIADFIELKRKLVRVNSNLRRIEILRLKNVSPTNHNLISRCKANLQSFLDIIIQDENCLKSEDLYLFFCPSSGNLRISLSFSKQWNFWNLPFASFFGINNPGGSAASTTNNAKGSDSSDEDIDELLFDDDIETKDDNVAEPLYNLLTEIFELKGAMGFLRRTLIVFVQTTYGQTINKQLRETVSWTCSESMLYYYLFNFKTAFWPNGQPAPLRPLATEASRHKNQFLAKRLLTDNIPDILSNLFGQQNCRKGLVKIFDFLQDQNLNKQLIYEIIESFLCQFVPQIRDSYEE